MEGLIAAAAAGKGAKGNIEGRNGQARHGHTSTQVDHRYGSHQVPANTKNRATTITRLADLTGMHAPIR
jgi:hypothetical protein